MKKRVPRKIRKKVGVFGHSFVATYNNYYTRKLNKFCPNVKFTAHGLKSSGISHVISELLGIRKGAYDEAIIHTGVNEIRAWKAETWEKFFERIQKKLKRAIKIARNKGVGRILLVEATPWKGYTTWNENNAEYTLRYNKLLAELAKDADVELVKLYDAMEGKKGTLNDEYSEDSLHPNKKGYEAIAKIIAESKYPQWIDLRGYVPLGVEFRESPKEPRAHGRERRRIVQ